MACGFHFKHEFISAGDAAGRMHHDRVTDRGPFRVKRLLDDQRALEGALREQRPVADALEPERKLGFPLCYAHVSQSSGP